MARRFVIGNAFVDACKILTNRYGGFQNYQSRLSSVRNLFGLAGPAAFAAHAVDGYTAGPLMTGVAGYDYNADRILTRLSLGVCMAWRRQYQPLFLAVGFFRSVENVSELRSARFVADHTSR